MVKWNKSKLVGAVSSVNWESANLAYTVIDGLWDDGWLLKVSNEVDAFEGWDGEKNFYGSVGKRWCSSRGKFPRSAAQLLEFLNSSRLLKIFEHASGLSGLHGDPEFQGGGLHSTRKGGMLKMHTDFTWNSTLSMRRRINVLVYLNQCWEQAWAGGLHLIDKANPGSSEQIVYPAFNRTIIFRTDENSVHGHPHPLACPPNISRNSLAVYWYSACESDFRKTDKTFYYDVAGNNPIGLHTKIWSKVKKIVVSCNE